MRGQYNGSHGSSPGSRSSRAQMPPIAEDEVAHRSDPAAATSSTVPRTPRTPLRVPQKIGQSAPPPYVPVTHISPPQYRHDESEHGNLSSGTSGSLDGRGSSDVGFEKQHHEHLHQQGNGASNDESSNRFKRWMDRQWFGSRRKRWTAFLGIGLLLVGIIVGLSVGLTLGLRTDGDGTSEDQSNNDIATADPVFPAGSYSFVTTLQQTSTACTSRSSTWRCFPYEQGSNTTFFWVIKSHESSPGRTDDLEYTISSTDNPFAPSFSNLTASIIDRNRPEERLTFSYDMEKTVIPSDSLTSDNRAAKCTFGRTSFEATLWTRRRDGRGTDSNRSAGKSFEPWPADIEVVQTKQSQEGEPRCEDRDGNAIQDVQAGDGECTCAYASFERA